MFFKERCYVFKITESGPFILVELKTISFRVIINEHVFQVYIN